MRRFGVFLTAIIAATSAYAQSTPSFIFGQVPTAAQWNSFFAAKQDLSFMATGNGATTSASAAARASVSLDIQNDFGAKFDGISHVDGVMTAGSATLSSASSAFVVTDVGKTIDVDFAGPSCGPLHTTIVRLNSATSVQLANAASCTIGYSYAYQWKVITPQSGTGSYAPGDTVSIAGGTSAVTATATVRATALVSATVVSGGTGGVTSANSSSGQCYIQGTTGTGVIGTFSATLTNGQLSSVDSVRLPGVYTANPNNLATEPVVPTLNCSGLAGAVVSVRMGAVVVAAPSHVAMGQYSVLPVSPAATTTSGAGVGLTISPVWIRAGNFVYGTDDSLAWQGAYTSSMIRNMLGQFNCIVLPGGVSIVSGTLPLWSKVAPCIKGQARDKSVMFLSAAYSGPALEVSDAWIASGQNSPDDGALTPPTTVQYGTTLRDFTILGTRFSPNKQQGVILADANDFVAVDGLAIRGLNSTCLGMGLLLNDTRSFTRESHFSNMQMQYCGSATDEAFYINSSVTGVSDDLHFYNIDIFASFGIGAHLKADGNAQVGENYFDRLRIESNEFDPEYANVGDNLVVGDNGTSNGTVSSNWFDKLELIDPYFNHYALRSDAVGVGATYNNHYSGVITGGSVEGSGLYVNSDRGSEYHFTSMTTRGYNVTFTSTAGASIDVTGVACNEADWTYSIAGPNSPVRRLCAFFAPGGPSLPTISIGANSGTTASGNAPGLGSVNLSLGRIAAWQVPAGDHSVSIGSANSSSTGSYNVDIGARSAQLSGNYTQAIAAYFPLDHSWPTSRILSGFSVSGAFAGSQVQETVLGCSTAATNAATCKLTSDGTGTQTITNSANPGQNSAQAANLVCSAHDRTNNTNALAWIGVPTLLMRQTTSASVVGAFGTVPTPLSIGTTTGATLTAAANTTIGGAALTFAAPTTNSAIWDITCHAPAVQTN